MTGSMVLDEQLLDDGEALLRADVSGALRAAASAGAMVRASLTTAQEAGIARLAVDGRPRSLVVASLGGSAVVADVLAMLAGAAGPVPVSVRRGLPLPGWVGPLDLVVAVSMSGRAPGPLGLAAEAARRGARLLTIGADRSPLAELAERTGGVHVPTPTIAASGPRASRLGVWSLLTPSALAAEAIGLSDAGAGVLTRVADRLDAVAEASRPASDAFVNPAKALAQELAGTIPVVLADDDVTAVAAARTTSMLARTARVPAMFGALPDDAGEVVATFGGPFVSLPEDVFADPFEDGPAATRLRLLLLRDAAPTIERPDPTWLDTSRTMDALQVTAREAGVRVSELTAEPGHPLERVAGLIGLTDFATIYLALASGIDPVTSPHVADLRDRTR
jgi:hypothetical protein